MINLFVSPGMERNVHAIAKTGKTILGISNHENSDGLIPIVVLN
jgi:hypothetical protein